MAMQAYPAKNEEWEGGGGFERRSATHACACACTAARALGAQSVTYSTDVCKDVVDTCKGGISTRPGKARPLVLKWRLNPHVSEKMRFEKASD